MGRPAWTDMHSLLLEAAEEGDPLPGLAEPTEEERELVRWGLVRWDAGCTPGHHLGGGGLQVRTPGVYITPAGLALLAALESLDGTAAPKLTRREVIDQDESTTGTP